MIVTEAVWEKRNLGCDVIEILCQEQDSCSDLIKQLTLVDVPYSVLKIPSGRVDLLIEAQNFGYKVLETSTTIEGKIKSVAVPDKYNRFMPHVHFEYADNAMKKHVLNEVKSGEIFETDRVAMDPFYSKEIAGYRYYNWCMDVMSNGAKMGIAYYKDEPVAFNVSIEKNNTGIFDGLIGGLFREAFNKGLGFLVVYVETELGRLNGGRKCLGRVSSNNLPILRLHLDFGYEIKELHYVLVKHNRA